MIDKCKWCLDHNLMEKYHDEEWGSVIHDDYKLFEYLVLESFQCGLSWRIVLEKRKALQESFANYDFKVVANFNEDDINKILVIPNMIKSVNKIKGVINNAKCFLKIVKQYGSFNQYLWSFSNNQILIYKSHQKNMPTTNLLAKQVSASLKKLGFKYVGDFVIYSYLQAIGMINDHEINCFKYKLLLKEKNIKFIEEND